MFFICDFKHSPANEIEDLISANSDVIRVVSFLTNFTSTGQKEECFLSLCMKL
jgi:hypothetical protein